MRIRNIASLSEYTDNSDNFVIFRKSCAHIATIEEVCYN
jgi:hypothetical protein